MKYCPHCEEVNKFLKGTSQPVVLTDPFPPQQQQMVAQTPSPPQGGNRGHSHHGNASSSISQVFMCKEVVSLMTKDKTYDTPLENHANGVATDNPSMSTLHLLLLFILRGLLLTQCCAHPRAQFKIQFLIQVHVLLKNTTLLKILHKHLVLC
jgi:hypothetical protein